VGNNNIVKKLLKWYGISKRDLPWRNSKNPYYIWLSEIILQQTRVDQGMPYYLKFVEKYPDIHLLANASEEDVLRTWQGLGYYSRARNLYKCAKTLVQNYKGNFPSTRVELEKLPGIGPYTSAAIASLAFGKKEAVVDGNVIRVITRLYGIKDDISNQKTKAQIITIVDDLIPESSPDQFNQAIMEFGALQCTPKNPNCEICEFKGNCTAQVKGSQHKIPFKSQKPKKRTRFYNYFLIEINGDFLLRKRIKNDIWKGLFEFFMIENDSDVQPDHFQFPKNLIEQKNDWEISSESKLFKHILSHQIIMCKFFNIDTDKNFNFNPMDWPEYKLYSKEEIDALPKSILINKYLEEELFD